MLGDNKTGWFIEDLGLPGFYVSQSEWNKARMLVFVDESGDTGLKLKENSSAYFVVAAVLFMDRHEATRCARAIERLALRQGRTHEYHFVARKDHVRKAFFECVREFDFIYASIVINKAKLHGEGFKRTPINEQGVVFLFGMVSDELGYIVEAVHATFPDCEAKRRIDQRNERWQRVRIEFEFRSRNSRDHGHDPNACDVIVCWKHNWPECPIEVVELQKVIDNLDRRDRYAYVVTVHGVESALALSRRSLCRRRGPDSSTFLNRLRRKTLVFRFFRRICGRIS